MLVSYDSDFVDLGRFKSLQFINNWNYNEVRNSKILYKSPEDICALSMDVNFGRCLFRSFWLAS
jgi:hypothetical protein